MTPRLPSNFDTRRIVKYSFTTTTYRPTDWTPRMSSIKHRLSTSKPANHPAPLNSGPKNPANTYNSDLPSAKSTSPGDWPVVTSRVRVEEDNNISLNTHLTSSPARLTPGRVGFCEARSSGQSINQSCDGGESHGTSRPCWASREHGGVRRSRWVT